MKNQINNLKVIDNNEPKLISSERGFEYYSFPPNINWCMFDWDKYSISEQNVLKPQLEATGFEVIKFIDGERDSFGPLSRVCVCKKNGKIYRLVYG